VAPEVPALIRGDAMRVRQVLINLAGNAIKFSRGRPQTRGRVSVRVELARARPLHMAMRVEDNGIGMSEETLGRLFTSFTQAPPETVPARTRSATRLSVSNT